MSQLMDPAQFEEYAASSAGSDEFKKIVAQLDDLRGDGIVIARDAPEFVMARAEPVHAATFPGAVYHPLLGPTVTSGTTINVEYALQNPTTVITPMIVDISLQRFIVDRLLTNAGGVTGGAVLYNEVEANDLYAERDVQEVAAGSEFPIITFSRRGVNVAYVRKWGGKFAITWEARDRNNVGELTRATTQLTNTIIRKLNQAAIAMIEAMVTAKSRQITGVNWATVVTTGSSASNHTLWPARDLARFQTIADQEELGINYNLIILNPQEMLNLSSIYGNDLSGLLQSFDYEFFVSNRVAAGTAYVAAAGQVGEMRLESPLTTRSWIDPNGIEQDWVQAAVRPLMFANNPFALLKVVGLAG